MRFRLGLRSKINQTGIDYCYVFYSFKKQMNKFPSSKRTCFDPNFRLRKQWNQPTRRCIHLRPNSLTGAGGFNFLVFIPAKVIPNMIRFFNWVGEKNTKWIICLWLIFPSCVQKG